MNQNHPRRKQSKDFIVFKSNNRTADSSSSQCIVKQQKNYQQIKPFEFELEPHRKQQNQHQCLNCFANLEKVTELKKRNIVIEYDNARLVQELDKTKKQNINLKVKLQQKCIRQISQISKRNLITAKQDLQAELFECKIINNLTLMSHFSKLQIQSQLKQRLESALMDKMILQQQLQQKSRIINDTVMYPIYHFDSRIKNLRTAVVNFYKIATNECKKIGQAVKMVKKQIQGIVKKIKVQIQNKVKEFLLEKRQYLNAVIFQDQNQENLNISKQKQKQNHKQKYKCIECRQKKIEKTNQLHNEKQNIDCQRKKTKQRQTNQTHFKKQKRKEEDKKTAKSALKNQPKNIRPCCVKNSQ